MEKINNNNKKGKSIKHEFCANKIEYMKTNTNAIQVPDVVSYKFYEWGIFSNKTKLSV